MICTNCNSDIPAGGKFCRKCGLPVALSTNELEYNSEEATTRELGTVLVHPAGMTSGSLENVPMTDRITTDFANKADILIHAQPVSQGLPKSGSSGRKIGIAIIAIALLSGIAGLGYWGLKKSGPSKQEPSTLLATEEVSSFLADYKTKETHAMARHILSSRPVAEDAIGQVSKLLANGGLELVDYKVGKSDPVGPNDVAVQMSGTIKLHGNNQPFNDSVIVHGDNGHGAYYRRLWIRSATKGTPSHMVGSFLETILLAKLETPAASQPQPKALNLKRVSHRQNQLLHSHEQNLSLRPRHRPSTFLLIAEGRIGSVVSKEEGWVLLVAAVPPYGPDVAGGQPKPIPGPSFGLQVVYVPAPKYTDAAKANKIQGSVFVIATFRADGTVANPQVVKGIGLTDSRRSIKRCSPR